MISKTEAKTGARIAQMKANIVGILEHYGFPPVTVLTTQVDRIVVESGESFREHLKSLEASGQFRTWRFNKNHGTTADAGWRENCWKCSMQVIHHSTGVWELDVDEYSPDYGALPALQHLFLEVFTPGKTNAYDVRRGLIKRGIQVPLIEAA
jgi:hypothetical protein